MKAELPQVCRYVCQMVPGNFEKFTIMIWLLTHKEMLFQVGSEAKRGSKSEESQGIYLCCSAIRGCKGIPTHDNVS